MEKLSRRNFTYLLAATASIAFVPRLLHSEDKMAPITAPSSKDPVAAIGKVEMTDAEWKSRLNDKQYEVLRHEDTEAPFTSPLNEEKHEGVFACAGCGLELFPSKFKFDSGTGWPSFFDSLPGRVATKTDYKMIAPRKEYHCARCGGHQGHIFEDGPAPTGLRYCNNGVALTFIARKA